MTDYYTANPGVVLDAAAAAYVAGKQVVVTSAYRDPDEQAAAMYGKFVGPE